MAYTELYVDPSIAADSGDGKNDDLRLSLSNATYDHTGNAEGERHLSLAGAFSGYTYSAGDRIYLLNAAGGVAEGSYEVASKVDNDAILLAADAGLTADSTADVDSSAGAYGDLEYCLKEEDWDATNGIRVNIKAGTDEALAAELSVAMADTTSANKSVAWAPSFSAPLVFQGYTTTAGDGGVGGISGGGTVSIINDTAVDHCNFIDMHIHNTGSNEIARLNDNCAFIRCEMDNSTAAWPVWCDGGPVYYQCYVHNVTGGPRCQIDMRMIHCFVEASSWGCFTGGGNSHVEGNIIKITGAAGSGADIRNGLMVVRNNSIYSTNNSTGDGLFITGTGNYVVLNNLIEGFSGTGGTGINITDTDINMVAYGGNGVYDCATPYDEYSGIRVMKDYGDNETLSASPFTSAGTDDYSPVDTDNVKEGSLPDAFYEG